MKALLQLAAALALLSFGAGAAVLSWDAHHLAHQFQSTLQSQNLSLVAEEKKLDTVLDVVNAAASEQRDYWKKTSADSDKTVKALRLTVDRAGLLLKHTDEQLNGALLPDVDREFTFTAQAAQGSLASIDHVADGLAFQVNQLDLGPALANLNESSARLANSLGYLQDASGHANNILAAGERTALYYEKKLTTPASFAHRMAITTLDLGSKSANIFAGFVK